jgi:phosphonoacetaldehyde hydrolase
MTQVRAVLLDWAGTTVDYGCIGPAQVFIELFAEQGVMISTAEARRPMGLFKRDHIRAVLMDAPVAARWQAVHGSAPAEAEVERLYQAFIPRQIAVIERHDRLIPGAAQAVEMMRARGLKIGSDTGYTRAMMAPLAASAAAQGYTPDAIVCPDEVRGGRPAPWMAFRNAERLDVYPMQAFVKIGDTISDIDEARNAGMWAIALAKCGNELGLTEAEVTALPAAELEARLEEVHARLRAAGAHVVVDTLLDAVPAIDAIAARAAAGERPW